MIRHSRIRGLDAVLLQGPDGEQVSLLLQGAHLLSWKPAGAGEQLYLSPASAFATGSPFEQTGAQESIFRVRASESEPEFASVKVFYRNRWFYIDDRDADSKTTFALVSMLQMLQSGETSAITPLITLPAN